MALSVWMGAGWPQAVSPPSFAPAQQTVPDRPALPQGAPASPQVAPAREENPGLLDEMGKMLGRSLSILPTLKSPGEAIDDLNARAKDAANNLSSYSSTATAHADTTVPPRGLRTAGAETRIISRPTLVKVPHLPEPVTSDFNSTERYTKSQAGGNPLNRCMKESGVTGSEL
ncbi:hypothetical protein B4Q13_25005, partial [Lacticaseibacillus rhamnosus]